MIDGHQLNNLQKIYDFIIKFKAKYLNVFKSVRQNIVIQMDMAYDHEGNTLEKSKIESAHSVQYNILVKFLSPHLLPTVNVKKKQKVQVK